MAAAAAESVGSRQPRGLEAVGKRDKNERGETSFEQNNCDHERRARRSDPRESKCGPRALQRAGARAPRAPRARGVHTKQPGRVAKSKSAEPFFRTGRKNRSVELKLFSSVDQQFPIAAIHSDPFLANVYWRDAFKRRRNGWRRCMGQRKLKRF